MDDLDKRLSQAISHFWATRNRQSKMQGKSGRSRDQGARTAVTGGKQMDGFVEIIRDVCISAGVPEAAVNYTRHVELPGYFRPEKKWDLLVVAEGLLLASLEFKSHVGPSFGNNFNNRSEEAIGNAVDLWKAYEEGAFPLEQRPWLGYVMLLEEARGSTVPVSTREPHFPVFPEFDGASYASRYEILLTKLVRERLYDSSCLLLSKPSRSRKSNYREPNPHLTFSNLVTSLTARLVAYAQRTS